MRILLFILSCVGCTGVGQLQQAASSVSVGVTTAVDKVRPSFVVPSQTSATLDAARNEFEAFQIVIGGAITGVTATATTLTGPGTILAPRLYQVGLYKVLYASNQEGAAGEWPDPLIPDVDAYAGEKRNAFPFDVPANESRAIWVEVFVPPDAQPGMYSGSVTVHAGADVVVPISLRVRNFALPSTATLKSAFGFSVDMACRAHMGQTFCNDDNDAKPWVELYGKAALDHRISFWNPYYTFPASDYTYFDSVTGTLLSGTAPTQLAGAKMTTTAVGTTNSGAMSTAASHFTSKGWKGLFQYTCDEPPATCAFSDIPVRAAAAHAAGIRTLVTTDIDTINKYSLGDAIDIATPVLDYMQPAGSTTDRRADYDSFLAKSPSKELWIYQSCDQHGCHAAGSCDASQASDPQVGWASYMIDAAGVQGRAMEWLSYRFRVSGELYYETVQHLDDAWNSHLAGHTAFCDFGGNGDGALFYPGKPSVIGGTTDIPVESQRLKLIREGMEDYEYLHLLDSLGGGATALAEVNALFPAAYKTTQATPAELYAARGRIADAIEARMGNVISTTRIPHAADSLAVSLAAGDASANFAVDWDETNLYLTADVTDPSLQVIGTGPDGELWNGDGIELMLDVNHDGMIDPGDRHVIVNERGDLLEARAFDDRTLTMNSLVKVSITSTGYRVELAVPWSGIGVAPSAGLKMGMDLALNNLDASMTLTPRDWAGILPFAQPALWHSVELAAAGADGGTDDGGAPPVMPGDPPPAAPSDLATPPQMNPETNPPTNPAPSMKGCAFSGFSRGEGIGQLGGCLLIALLLGWRGRRRRLLVDHRSLGDGDRRLH